MGRVVVVGGGIAGLATARALAVRGREVVLFEREALPGTASTGRNAAIFRLAVAEPVNVRLALRTREIGAELVTGGVVTGCGGLYPCLDDAVRRSILGAARCAGVREARPGELPPFVRPGPAIASPQDGVIDTGALVQALARDAVRHGAVIRLRTSVDSLDVQAGRVTGVVAGGERVPAETVVDATGAWSPGLPGAEGIDVGVRPARRHLMVLDTPEAARVRGILWDLVAGFYVRPESGGVLASPCDETAMDAADVEVPVSSEAPALLFDKLARLAPALADASVRRCWAGLRPLTPDHRFVVGPDPVLEGLFRAGGFGGHGMSAGAAAGEVAAALLCDGRHELAAELSPARFGAGRG